MQPVRTSAFLGVLSENKQDNDMIIGSQLEQMIETVSSRVDNWFSEVTEFLGGVSISDGRSDYSQHKKSYP